MIQGSAASMTKYALSLIYEYQLKNKAWDTFKVVNVVHDEIVIETNEEMANISGSVVQWAMVKAGKRFCSSIPMVAEPKISKEWSH